MIRPDIDGRLAERLRDLAKWQTDSLVEMGGVIGKLTAEAKADVLNVAADLLEEYIMAYKQPVDREGDNG